MRQRACPLCGRLLGGDEICPCRGASYSDDQVDLSQALKDFTDYLDDRVAPVLVQSSIAYILNTSPSAPMPAGEIAEYILRLGQRRTARAGANLSQLILRALDAIVKAEQYGILDSFDGETFYPAFIQKVLDSIPPEDAAAFKEELKFQQEGVWELLAGKSTHPEQRFRDAASPSEQGDRREEPVREPFASHIKAILDQAEICDQLLENGAPDFQAHFDKVDREIRNTPGFDEKTRKMTEAKKTAVQLFNRRQVMGAWLLANAVDEELAARKNDLITRMIYEVVSTQALNWDFLKECLGNAVYHPLLAPFCRLFHEFAPRELLLLLLTESDQAYRRIYYNLLKVYDATIFPLLMHELESPANHPWYYIRNIVSLIGELSFLSEGEKVQAIKGISKHLFLGERRQLVIAAIHAVARLDGPEGEKLLVGLLHQRQIVGSGEVKETLASGDYAVKLVEGLCMINTESSIGEVVEIAQGGKVEVTNLQESVQYYALEQLSKMDLNLFPALMRTVTSYLDATLAIGKFSFKKLFAGRNTRFEMALLRTLRQTRGPESEAILKRIAEMGPPELEEEARRILDDQSRNKDLHYAAFFRDAKDPTLSL